MYPEKKVHYVSTSHLCSTEFKQNKITHKINIHSNVVNTYFLDAEIYSSNLALIKNLT